MEKKKKYPTLMNEHAMNIKLLQYLPAAFRENVVISIRSTLRTDLMAKVNMRLLILIS